MGYKEATPNAATIAALNDVPAFLDRLRQAAEVAQEEQGGIDYERDLRNVALFAMHRFHGLSKADCYREADIDRRTLDEGWVKLPAAMLPNPAASREYRIAVQNPGGAPVEVTVTEDVAALLAGSTGGPVQLHCGNMQDLAGVPHAASVQRRPGAAPKPRFLPRKRQIKWSGLVYGHETVIIDFDMVYPAPWPSMAPGAAYTANSKVEITRYRDSNIAVRGETARYRLVATNTSTEQVTTTVSEPIISGTRGGEMYLEDASTDRGRVRHNDTAITWKGTLKPGQSATVVYSVGLPDAPDAPNVVETAPQRTVDVSSDAVEITMGQRDLIAHYAGLIRQAGEDDLIAFFLDLLSYDTPHAKTAMREQIAKHAQRLGNMKAAILVRDEMIRQLAAGKYENDGVGQEVPRATLGRIAGVSSQGVSQIVHGTRNVGPRRRRPRHARAVA